MSVNDYNRSYKVITSAKGQEFLFVYISPSRPLRAATKSRGHQNSNIGFGAGYMYLTLRSEDHALLLGSLLLFGTLAGAMIVTRGFDWYAVGGRLTGTRAGSSEGREIN
jgi:hypothetical protein